MVAFVAFLCFCVGLCDLGLRLNVKETLINLIPLMVRQARHERNQKVTVHPELVEGFNQRILNY